MFGKYLTSIRLAWNFTVAISRFTRRESQTEMSPKSAIASSNQVTSLPASGLSGVKETRAVVIAYAITSFLSAFLLFQVQLIVSKYILPWFGGSAAVWTTSMLVFQVLLLGGYLYSHLVSLRLSPESQVRLHLGLLAAAFLLVMALSLSWPSAITPDTSWRPTSSRSPVLDVAVIILISAGLPFFVLSTTAPLLQRWFARLGGDARTYRLYSLSNLGSLLGLLTFPFLLEPTLRIRTQGILWTMLFCLFVGGCAWCGWQALRTRAEPKPEGPIESSARIESGPLVRVLWFLLAACASSLLLATTNLLCQEVISLPLLWVVPLSLYLLSFILCFDHPRWYQRAVFHPLFALSIFVLLIAMRFAFRTTQVIVLPLLLFVACMICHGELVRLKPAVRTLTTFYLSIAAGGALGGVFVAVVAPHIFTFFTEFQISLAASVVLLLGCLVLDSDSWLFQLGFWLPAGIVGGAVVAAYAISRWIAPVPQFLEDIRFYPIALLIGTLVLAGAYVQRTTNPGRKRDFRFVQILVLVLAVLSMVLLYQSAQPESALYRGERNFYGALRIYELAQGGKALFHGHTLHGAQLNPPNDRLPMAYYGPDSGIGAFLQNHPKRSVAPGNMRVGVVGLGAGTLAVYGRPGDYFRYYEINPAVNALSTGPQPVFTYVRDSAARVDIKQGDARLLLEGEAVRAELQQFDVLVLDAFAGDAVPVHLLTREAFDTYWQHLNRENGVIAIHVSSRHIDLLPVLEGLTAHYHGYSLVRFTDGSYPFLESLWVFIARRPEALEVDGLSPNPPPFRNSIPPRVWTDDYSDIFRLLY